jgi:hypothetical protein
MPPHVPYGLRGLPSRLWSKCNRLLRLGRPWGAVNVVPMRWMVIYEYEVPGGALNLSSTKLPWPWSPWGSSPSRKNSHGRSGNRTRDFMISSQKLWPLDHEAGHIRTPSWNGKMKTNFLIHIFEIRDMQYGLTVPLHSNSLLIPDTYT